MKNTACQMRKQVEEQEGWNEMISKKHGYYLEKIVCNSDEIFYIICGYNISSLFSEFLVDISPFFMSA